MPDAAPSTPAITAYEVLGFKASRQSAAEKSAQKRYNSDWHQKTGHTEPHKWNTETYGRILKLLPLDSTSETLTLFGRTLSNPFKTGSSISQGSERLRKWQKFFAGRGEDVWEDIDGPPSKNHMKTLNSMRAEKTTGSRGKGKKRKAESLSAPSDEEEDEGPKRPAPKKAKKRGRETTQPSAKKTGRKTASQLNDSDDKEDEEEEEEEDEEEDDLTPPSKKRKSPLKRTQTPDEDDEDDEEKLERPPPRKTKPPQKRARTAVTDDEDIIRPLPRKAINNQKKNPKRARDSESVDVEDEDEEGEYKEEYEDRTMRKGKARASRSIAKKRLQTVAEPDPFQTKMLQLMAEFQENQKGMEARLEARLQDGISAQEERLMKALEDQNTRHAGLLTLTPVRRVEDVLPYSAGPSAGPDSSGDPFKNFAEPLSPLTPHPECQKNRAVPSHIPIQWPDGSVTDVPFHVSAFYQVISPHVIDKPDEIEQKIKVIHGANYLQNPRIGTYSLERMKPLYLPGAAKELAVGELTMEKLRDDGWCDHKRVQGHFAGPANRLEAADASNKEDKPKRRPTTLKPPEKTPPNKKASKKKTREEKVNEETASEEQPKEEKPSDDYNTPYEPEGGVHAIVTIEDFMQRMANGEREVHILDIRRPFRTLDAKYYAANDVPGSLFNSTVYLKMGYSDDQPSTDSWELLHHKGTASTLHHDAAGLITTACCKFGSKEWFVAVTKEAEIHPEQLYNMYFEVFDALRKNDMQKCGEALTRHFDIVKLNMEAGDLLQMGPGTLHFVITPENAWCVGWHELRYDTLLLTEVSRRFDARHSLISTNTDHPSAFDMLDRLFYRLSVDKDVEISNPNLLALAVMVHWPEKYLTKDTRTRLMQELAASTSDTVSIVLKRMGEQGLKKNAAPIIDHIVEDLNEEANFQDQVIMEMAEEKFINERMRNPLHKEVRDLARLLLLDRFTMKESGLTWEKATAHLDQFFAGRHDKPLKIFTKLRNWSLAEKGRLQEGFGIPPGEEEG